jgi:hypothetical protein
VCYRSKYNTFIAVQVDKNGTTSGNDCHTYEILSIGWFFISKDSIYEKEESHCDHRSLFEKRPACRQVTARFNANLRISNSNKCVALKSGVMRLSPERRIMIEAERSSSNQGQV